MNFRYSRCLTTISVLLSLAFPSLVRAATLNVPSAAYPTIQSGVDASHDGDAVLVGDGTYTGPGNRDIDFKGKNIIVTSQNGPAKTIIDCGGSASTDGSGNHRGFYIHSGEKIAAISGFTVKNGYESYVSSIFGSGFGGGIYNLNYNGGTLTLTNCTVSGNSTTYSGGGIYNLNYSGGTTMLTNCTASGNTSSGIYNDNSGIGTITLVNCTTSGNTGGGIINTSFNGGTTTVEDCAISKNSASGVENLIGGNSTITITNCDISSNSATSNGGAGGGVFNQSSSINFTDSGTITLKNCNITDNTATNNGGGVYSGTFGNTINITDCRIAGNRADYGGGVDNHAQNNNHGETGTITLSNCTVLNNTAVKLGGGIFNQSQYLSSATGHSTINLTACSTTGNTANDGGGIYNDTELFGSPNNNFSSKIILSDSIFYGDSDREIVNKVYSSSSLVTHYCDIQNFYDGTSNIADDPLFFNAATGDLHVKPGSPCLSKGTSTGAPATDKDGKVRPSPPSIGAYEYAAAQSTAVLLVHGTFSSAQVWNGGMSQSLAAHGFTVEAVDFPTEPETRSNETYIEFQAQAIQRRVYELMARSGQRSVSLVCHSMGGLAARYYLEHPELQPKDGAGLPYSGVSTLIMLGTPNWGTDAPLLDPVSTVSLAHYATLPKLANGESVARDQYDNWGPAISEQFAEWEPAPETDRPGHYYYPTGEKLYSWPLNRGSFYSPIKAQSYLLATFVSDTVPIFGDDYNAETAVLLKFPEARRQRNPAHLAYYPQAAQKLGEDYPSNQGVHGVNKRLVSRFLADLNSTPSVRGVAYYLVAGTEPVAEKFQPFGLLFSFSLVTVPGPFAAGIQNDGVIPTDSELGINPLTGISMFPNASDLVLNTYHLDLPNNPEVIEQVAQWLRL